MTTEAAGETVSTDAAASLGDSEKGAAIGSDGASSALAAEASSTEKFGASGELGKRHKSQMSIYIRMSLENTRLLGIEILPLMQHADGYNHE